MIAEFINSPLFIAVLGGLFTLCGWAFNTLFAKIKAIDERAESTKDKVSQLEFSSVELINTKVSISNIGERVGRAEGELAVHRNTNEQLFKLIQEIKESEKESNVAFASILTSINEVKVDLAIIKIRLDQNEKENHK